MQINHVEPSLLLHREDEAVAEYEEKPPGGATDVPAGGGHDTVKEKYRKSLKLTSDEIVSSVIITRSVG